MSNDVETGWLRGSWYWCLEQLYTLLLSTRFVQLVCHVGKMNFMSFIRYVAPSMAFSCPDVTFYLILRSQARRGRALMLRKSQVVALSFSRFVFCICFDCFGVNTVQQAHVQEGWIRSLVAQATANGPLVCFGHPTSHTRLYSCYSWLLVFPALHLSW